MEVRSYSRNSGRIWCEMESGTASGLQRFGDGFFVLWIREREEQRDRDGLRLVRLTICSARARNSCDVGAVRISPSLAVRSLMPKRRSFGTSGSMRSKKKS